MTLPARLIILIIAACSCLALPAQTNRKIEELKGQRGQLQQQIKQSESLLLSAKKDVKSQLGDLQLINSRLGERRKLIKTIEADINALNTEMRRLEKQNRQLQADLEQKQQRYAESVKYLRKTRSLHKRLMFIFSADNFNQMLRRMRYVNEYAGYQRQQGEQIKAQQAEIETKHKEIQSVKDEKNSLLAQREQERKEIEKQEKQQRALVDKLQKRQRNLQAELKRQRQQSQQLNAKIDRLIEQEIAAAKKRAEEEAARKRKAAAAKKGASETATGEPKGKDIDMMEEHTGDRKLSSVFIKNKGRLPMPITGPYAIVSRFGQYKVEGLKNVTLDNKGINIKGENGAKARTVFDGTVTSIFQLNGLTGVLVRHGDYISVYCNLLNASVKYGQQLKTGEALGTIAPDSSGNIILHFQIRKETQKLNPEAWLGR